ncbi:hypothetical protein D9M68_927900 [compost metagenome]
MPFAGKANLDLLGIAAHTLDAHYDLLDLGLLRIVGHVPRQRYNAIFHGHADVGGINAGFEVQLVIDQSLQTFVVHFTSPDGRALDCPARP